MWELKSEYESSGIKAKSFRAKDGIIESYFDFGVFFGSYESRGLASSKCLKEKSCQNSIIVFFTEKDEKGLRKRYDSILYEQVKKCSVNEPIVINDKSINDFETIINDILILWRGSKKSDNYSWFMDTTSSPKPYYLMILSYFRNKIESPNFTFFNATGHYEKNQDEPDVYSFTEGFEEYILIPGLWGEPDPRLPWTYFFLLGFEGDRSYGTYDKYEPRFVKALISDPGYRSNYHDIALIKNKQFLDEACPDIITADAADAVEAWKRIDTCIKEIPVDTNICIVPLGTKPHTIGGGLSALTDWKSSLLYLKPKGHKVRDIVKGDYIWKYEISL